MFGGMGTIPCTVLCDLVPGCVFLWCWCFCCMNKGNRIGNWIKKGGIEDGSGEKTQQRNIGG